MPRDRDDDDDDLPPCMDPVSDWSGRSAQRGKLASVLDDKAAAKASGEDQYKAETKASKSKMTGQVLGGQQPRLKLIRGD